MENKLILINGPMNIGKDKLVDEYNALGVTCLHKAECKEELHKLTMKFFHVDEDLYWSLYERKYRDVPTEHYEIPARQGEELVNRTPLSYEDLWTKGVCTLYLTPRQAMIYISEVVVKPNFGYDWFGKARAHKIEGVDGNEGRVFVDPSAAFVEELPPVIKLLGQENILLLRIYRDGSTFDGDSRSYLPDGVISNTIDIYNNGTLENYIDEGTTHINKWLLSKGINLTGKRVKQGE